jgi:hypothetical protein
MFLSPPLRSQEVRSFCWGLGQVRQLVRRGDLVPPRAKQAWQSRSYSEDWGSLTALAVHGSPLLGATPLLVCCSPIPVLAPTSCTRLRAHVFHPRAPCPTVKHLRRPSPPAMHAIAIFLLCGATAFTSPRSWLSRPGPMTARTFWEEGMIKPRQEGVASCSCHASLHPTSGFSTGEPLRWRACGGAMRPSRAAAGRARWMIYTRQLMSAAGCIGCECTRL